MAAKYGRDESWEDIIRYELLQIFGNENLMFSGRSWIAKKISRSMYFMTFIK